MTVLTIAAAFVIAATTSPGLVGASLDGASPLDANIADEHLIIRSSVGPRDWSGLRITLNRWWSVTIPKRPAARTVCVRLAAFTVDKRFALPAGDYSGIRFDPRKMGVTRMDVDHDGAVLPLHSATAGLLRVSPADLSKCIGQGK